MHWRHSSYAARKKNCQCPECIEDRKVYNRAKDARRRERDPNWGKGSYEPTSIPCRTCGNRVNHKFGHRYDQCWDCREVERLKRYREERALIRAAREDTKPKCNKCAKPLSASGRSTCQECLRANNVTSSSACLKCGKPMLATHRRPDPVCPACRNPHGMYGWYEGCRCDICCQAERSKQERARNKVLGRKKQREQSVRAAINQKATRRGHFTQWEDDVIMRDDLSEAHKAIALGRTIDSVQNRRKRLRGTHGPPGR